MKNIQTALTSIAISLSSIITTAAIAAPSYDTHFQPKPPTANYWNENRHAQVNDQRYIDKKHVNPSRDWKVGQSFPHQFHLNHYKVDYRDSRHLNKPGRNQAWYNVNGDYVLVNTKNDKIIRIIG